MYMYWTWLVLEILNGPSFETSQKTMFSRHDRINQCGFPLKFDLFSIACAAHFIHLTPLPTWINVAKFKTHPQTPKLRQSHYPVGYLYL